MIYEAIVIDNANFFKLGTITVRIAGFYFGDMTWNLVDGFPNSVNETKIDDTTNLDFEALVSSSMGGGRNYGIFTMPQINEKGIVAFLNGSEKKIIWLGSLFEAKRDDNYEITAVNIPSDKLEAEGTNQDGAVNGSANLDAPDDATALKKNIIIRTKNTVLSNDKNDIDWEVVNTTNIISIGEDEVKVIHFDPKEGWDNNSPKKYQNIIINQDTDGKNVVEISNINKTDTKQSKIDIYEDNIVFYTNGDNGENTFIISSGDDNSMTITDVNNNQITLNSDGITFNSNGKVNITGSDKIILKDDEGGAVRIKELKSILSAFESHIHMCPTGPTVGSPMDSSYKPISAVNMSDKQNIESKDVGMK